MSLKRLLLLPLQFVVAIFVVIDELVRPLYLPLIRRFAELRIVEICEAAISRLPRYVILVMLAVPIAVAEPLKIYGLLKIGEGKLIRGVVILVLAYLVSFLLIERIYEAGRPKLLTIGWLPQLIGFVAWIRAVLLDWVKRTPIWALVTATRQFTARLIATIRSRA